MAASVSNGARVYVLNVRQHVRLFGRLFQRLALCGLLVLVVEQLLWWWASQGTSRAAGLVTSALSLFALVVFVGLLLGCWLWLLFSRYRLLLGPSWVALDSGGRLRHRLERGELEHLCEGPMGLVLVRRTGLALRIPRSIAGYEQVRGELSAWQPFTAAGRPGFRPWLTFTGKLAIVIASLVLLAACVLLLVVVNVLAQTLSPFG